MELVSSITACWMFNLTSCYKVVVKPLAPFKLIFMICVVKVSQQNHILHKTFKKQKLVNCISISFLYILVPTDSNLGLHSLRLLTHKKHAYATFATV